jgi:hypothetical protein
MKKNLVILTLVVAFTLTGFGFAGASANTMRISVPFDFYAGNEQLPAGEYTFAVGSNFSTVTIRTMDGTGLCFLLAKTGTNTAEDRLLFNKYGNKHFLSGVAIQGVKAEVKMVKLEKELRAQVRDQQHAILYAQK